MDFYIFEDYSDLENLPLVNNEWTFYPILFPWWLLHFFIIDVSIFNTNEEKEGKNQFFNYFWRMLLKFEEKNLEIHKLSWLLITWILKKLNSIQTLVENIPEIKLSHWYLLSKTYKKSHLKTWTLIVLKTYVCYSNNCLVPLRILSYQESTVVTLISSLMIYKILFSFFWLSTIQILFWNLLTVSTVKTSHKAISEIFVQLRKKPPYFCPLEVIFK